MFVYVAKTTHLAVTELLEAAAGHGLVELVLEQLAVEEEPRAAQVPRDGGAARIVGEERHLHAAHEERRQLHSTGCDVWNLRNKTI